MELLAAYEVKMWMFWGALALLAFLVKCFTREYVSLSVGIGALITVVACMFFTHKITTLVIVFGVATLLFALLLQPYAIRKNEERRMRQAMEKNVPFFQKTGEVIEEIDNMAPSGRIRIEDSVMRARSATGIIHKVGEKVRVVDHDRDILIVI